MYTIKYVKNENKVYFSSYFPAMAKPMVCREVVLFSVKFANDNPALLQKKQRELEENPISFSTMMGVWYLTVASHLAEDNILFAIKVDTVCSPVELIPHLERGSTFGNIVDIADGYIRVAGPIPGVFFDKPVFGRKSVYLKHNLIPVNRAVSYLFPEVEIESEVALEPFHKPTIDAESAVPFGIKLDDSWAVEYNYKTLVVNLCGPEYVGKSGVEEAMEVYKKVCKKGI